MELPPSDVSAPSVPKHLLKRLKSIDPGLEVRFFCFQPNPITLRPHLSVDTGEPFLRPRWYVYSRGNNGKYYLLFVHESHKKEFLPFDERLLKRLEHDPLRWKNIEQVLREQDEAEDMREERGMEKLRALRGDFVAANKSKISSVMRDPVGNRLRETESIKSYKGQSNRSRINKVVNDDQDYEKPDWNSVLEQ